MSTKGIAYWAAGQLLTNKWIVPSVMLYTMPAGRQLVHGYIGASARYSYDIAKVTGATIRDSAIRNFSKWKTSAPGVWIAANPLAVGMGVLAVAGAVGSHQSMAKLGSGVRVGEVQPPGAIAPSQHLVEGKPWWEAAGSQRSLSYWARRQLFPFSTRLSVD